MKLIYFPHKLGQKLNGVQYTYKMFKNKGLILDCKNTNKNNRN